LTEFVTRKTIGWLTLRIEVPWSFFIVLQPMSAMIEQIEALSQWSRWVGNARCEGGEAAFNAKGIFVGHESAQ